MFDTRFGHTVQHRLVWSPNDVRSGMMRHVHKVSCLGLSGEKVTFLLAHFPRGLQLH